MRYTEKEYNRADGLRFEPQTPRPFPTTLYLGKEDETTTMASFSRPADNFWTGFAIQLEREGYTVEQTREILQSKYMRWMFDGDGEKVMSLGAKMAREFMSENRESVNAMLKDECNLPVGEKKGTKK